MDNEQSYEGLQEKIRDLQMPDIEVLKTPYPAPGHEYTIKIVAPEFTCVCPKTGHPDFATITIEYIPDQLIMELKSLKLYLQAYRMIGVFHENLANKLLHDITKACEPLWCSIVVEMGTRGGIDTTVEAATDWSDKYETRNQDASKYVMKRQQETEQL